MSLERLEGERYITTACRPHDDGKPCETCWPHTCETHQRVNRTEGDPMRYRGTLLWPLAAALIAFATWVGKRLEAE